MSQLLGARHEQVAVQGLPVVHATCNTGGVQVGALAVCLCVCVKMTGSQDVWGTAGTAFIWTH